MVASQLTRRVVPNATVNGCLGSGCSRWRSSASISAGVRRVARCTRALTSSQKARQAASSTAKLRYSSSRLTSLGTRSALAMRTVASEPPLVSGSAGRQVRMVVP